MAARVVSVVGVAVMMAMIIMVMVMGARVRLVVAMDMRAVSPAVAMIERAHASDRKKVVPKRQWLNEITQNRVEMPDRES